MLSHLRIGEEAGSPLIAKGEADLIIGFEPGESVRALPFLKKDGVVVTSSRPVMPVSAMIGASVYDDKAMIAYLKENIQNLVIVDAAAAEETLGSARTLNTVLLGAALRSGGLDILSLSDITSAIEEKVAERFRELNLKALAWGMEEH